MRSARLAIVIGNPKALDVFFRRQVEYFQANGLEVHAICAAGPELDEFQTATRAEIHVVPIRRRMTPLADIRSVWHIRRTLRRLAPDIVHAHMPKPGLLGMIAAASTGSGVRFFTYHGLPSETLTGWRRNLANLTDRVTSALATNVLAVSPSLRETIIRRRLCPAAKIRVLGYGSCAGVDLTAFDPGLRGEPDRNEFRKRYGIPSDALVLGYVGRLARDKGIQELALAWSELRERYGKLWLFLCGFEDPDDPPDAESLTRLYHDGRVRASRGLVRDMPGVYAGIDLLVLPSYREGFGMVAIEAAAMEIPIVGTRVDGIVDAVQDGVTGILVAPRNSSQLTHAIESLILDRLRWRAMEAAARSFVKERFSAASVSRTMLQEYRSALLARRNGARFSESWKRRFDFSASLFLLLATSPVLGIAMAAVRLSLGAPVVFTQARGGRYGRPFTLYKLRTMSERRDSDGSLLPDRERLTMLGRILRITSVDELPQLWNVLKGDMSLVGPRPLLVAYCGRYNAFEARRHEVRPGITGWAQVNGRNSLSWQEKFRLDIWYVDHQCFALDLRILLMTAWRALRPRGIDSCGQQSVSEFTGTDPGVNHG